MRLVLILMIKNEEKILKRCLEAVENVVDAFCIHDTGSTDRSVQIAEDFLQTHKGCVSISKWKDFGYNRTRSFKAAQTYIHDCLKWDLKDTYGLLLDADMVFVPGILKEQTLTEPGYTLVQCNGSLEYSNTRLVRMDYSWTCKGVTHEYWDGPTQHLAKNIASIDDRNDGGCKSDKFERDAKLLERGLKEEPTNVRYMFYLAQTYHCVNRHADAIQMYKKRIRAGGWDEEVWYSYYTIGECYHRLKNYPKFEEWMLKAHAFRPTRAEALYKLAKHFREVGQQYKAYQYVEQGTHLPFPSDVLFVERPVYDGLFEYERSILDYYVKDAATGLRTSTKYLLRSDVHAQNVLANLAFYARPIGTTRRLELPAAFGDSYRTSVVSIATYPFANVRYVNYWIENGEYKTPPGEPVRTQNAYVNLETNEVLARMDDSTIELPRHETRVLGLEDVRLYDNKFVAVVQEFGPGVSVLQGTYDWETASYRDCKVLPSPTGRSCEKNWLPIPGTNTMIYDWSPFRTIGDTETSYDVPPLFKLLRGSAPPIRVEDELWALTHFVEYSKPRKYYHCCVALDGTTYKPKAITLPFVFQSASIEYCVSMRMNGDTLECYTSFQDKDSSVSTIPRKDLVWFNLNGQPLGR